jgi:hypothetical protein
MTVGDGVELAVALVVGLPAAAAAIMTIRTYMWSKKRPHREGKLSPSEPTA